MYLTTGSASEVSYVGYPLHLSGMELRIVRALTLRAEQEPGTYTETQTLQALCRLPEEGEGDSDGSTTAPPCSSVQIAVLVNRINKKACTVGGRRLIVSHANRGYRLNPYM